MPEDNKLDQEPTDKRQFINEKIVKQPLSRRELAGRAAVFAGFGAVFGVVAAVTFVLACPALESCTGKEADTEQTAVSIPRDEEVPPTTVAEEPSSEAPSEEPIEEQVEKAVAGYRFTIDDFRNIYAPLKQTAADVDKSIVTVHSVRHETDWFNNPVENTGYYAGAVIAETGTEYLILTTEEAVTQADAIRVTFSDDTEVSGTKKQTDKVSGMSVISVSKADVDNTMVEKVQVLPLGNSHQMKMGDVVIAVGSPIGVVHSIDYGTIDYVAKNVAVADGSIRILYTDASGNAEKGTFLMNLSGEIVGWVTTQFANDNVKGTTAVVGISDYKGVIERMSNGMGTAYLGIKGQDITRDMEAQGLPAGIYITEVVSGSPAYEAGIQNGDILTEIAGQKVSTVRNMQQIVEGLQTGSTISVQVKRNGRDEYKELEYQVTVGAR